ncbi:hypothetical protein Y032_0173g410 [Ancylostoma ceylanicum]|uniref:Uncharacterized protein n=1 Tax=Ancylostoma ceylanicum TaxID=53326 RepID=A0A016SV89_9BILA|nr:hypothetical protein Y032_0173g410 [Ancylostoma ceylanicum]
MVIFIITHFAPIKHFQFVVSASKLKSRDYPYIFNSALWLNVREGAFVADPSSLKHNSTLHITCFNHISCYRTSCRSEKKSVMGAIVEACDYVRFLILFESENGNQ